MQFPVAARHSSALLATLCLLLSLLAANLLSSKSPRSVSSNGVGRSITPPPEAYLLCGRAALTTHSLCQEGALSATEASGRAQCSWDSLGGSKGYPRLSSCPGCPPLGGQQKKRQDLGANHQFH